MTVWVIYDDYNFVTVGVVAAESEAKALEIAEREFESVLNHRYEANRFDLVSE